MQYLFFCILSKFSVAQCKLYYKVNINGKEIKRVRIFQLQTMFYFCSWSLESNAVTCNFLLSHCSCRKRKVLTHARGSPPIYMIRDSQAIRQTDSCERRQLSGQHQKNCLLHNSAVTVCPVINNITIQVSHH